MKQEFLIALGSNLGSDMGGPSQTVASALVELHKRNVTLRRVSRFFATPCFPAGAGPDYVNACAALSADKTPGQVLDILHEVEAIFGRKRVQRWGSRTLDLDLIAAQDSVLPDRQTHADWRHLQPDEQTTKSPDTLILPHPRVQDRAFVLVPLCDVAAGWRHPLLNQTARQLCAALPEKDRASVRPL